MTDRSTVTISSLKKSTGWIFDHINLMRKHDSQFKGSFRRSKIASFRIWRSKEKKKEILFTAAVWTQSTGGMEVIYRASLPNKKIPFNFIDIDLTGDDNYSIARVE